MPELPEVETIKRDLEKAVLDKKIVEVRIYNPMVIRQINPEKFRKELAGVKIKNVRRKAKVLVIGLSSGKFLVIHLKMTGQLVYPGDAKNSRVSFLLSDGKTLDFNDQRLFGELRILDDWRSLKFIQRLGPEPFDLSQDDFKEMLSRKKTKIKSLLMDQTFISGIGNLYAAESLFGARIHPERVASSLSDKEKEALLGAIKNVLSSAITYGGSSVDNYVRLSGKPGDYVRHHKVYGREGKLCLVCSGPIKKMMLGGRGTYFCPRCQK
ncbi:MAG: DNA-formamidopyrimidine glycosylase [Deltaproteobacteria bacterium]